MAKPAIGYVGVGLMGLPMLKRLVSLGYAVTAYDIAPGQMKAAQKRTLLLTDITSPLTTS